MNWELIFFISFGFIVLMIHVIPCLAAIYYLIIKRQWFLLIPIGILFATPIIGTLLSWIQIMTEGEELTIEDMPLLIQIIFLGPLSLLAISAIMMLIC